MDFSELLNDIISNETFKAIWNLIGPTIITIIGILWAKTKKKLAAVANDSNSNLNQIITNIKTVVNKLDAVEARCAVLAEENKKKDEEIAKLTNSIISIGNMVSIGFLDTKGISADAKIKISESVSCLAKNGLDITKTQEAVDIISEKTEQSIEAINQFKEIVEIKAKESEEKAAATETEAIDILNKIVATHEQ